MTKGALAKELAKKFKISLRNAYTHVYQELNDNLVPSGIVEWMVFCQLRGDQGFSR
jgi:hypothetical protein